MAIVYFTSMEQADTIEVAFDRPQGGEVVLRLLVDSGFTGQSCFVLPEDAAELAQALAPAAQASGALQGAQKRVVVACHIAAISFQVSVMTILADIATLELPPGISGMVGLRFLRHFRRWGAEQIEDGSWRFFLETHSV